MGSKASLPLLDIRAESFTGKISDGNRTVHPHGAAGLVALVAPTMPVLYILGKLVPAR